LLEQENCQSYIMFDLIHRYLFTVYFTQRT